MNSSGPSRTYISDISPSVAAIIPSATLEVDARAKALRAAGEPVVEFGGGEPDFPTPDFIVEAAAAACREVSNHRYSPTAGLPDLREAIAAKTLRDSSLEISPSQVVVTNGGKHAVYNAFRTLLSTGDEVLLPAPYWTSYPEIIRLCGAVPVEIPTSTKSMYRLSVEQLEAAWTPQTKALVFVSPSNPTGAVYPPDEVEAIGNWAASRGVWVLADEIYEHLVYDGNEHRSIAKAAPAVAERCVILNGVAKTYAMTGWRVGWIVAPEPFVKAATNLQSHQTSNVCNVAQRAAQAAITGPLDVFAEMLLQFDRRRRSLHRMISEIEGVDCPLPQGAFYAFPSVEGVLGREIAGRHPETSLELAELLLSEAKVAVVPGEAFGAPGCVRLSFALSSAQIVEGMSRVAELLG